MSSGIVYPTRTGMSHGTARESAFQNSQSANSRQVMANSMAAGSKKKKNYRRGGGQNVPQVQVLYTPAGGTGTDPNSQIKYNTSTLMQTHANKQYDSSATKMGGSRKKRGGNPNWNWPCSSGGKRRSTKKRTKRTRKSKKTRRARR